MVAQFFEALQTRRYFHVLQITLISEERPCPLGERNHDWWSRSASLQLLRRQICRGYRRKCGSVMGNSVVGWHACEQDTGEFSVSSLLVTPLWAFLQSIYIHL
jgi:hypothetical protein